VTFFAGLFIAVMIAYAVLEYVRAHRDYRAALARQRTAEENERTYRARRVKLDEDIAAAEASRQVAVESERKAEMALASARTDYERALRRATDHLNTLTEAPPASTRPKDRPS